MTRSFSKSIPEAMWQEVSSAAYNYGKEKEEYLIINGALSYAQAWNNALVFLKGLSSKQDSHINQEFLKTNPLFLDLKNLSSEDYSNIENYFVEVLKGRLLNLAVGSDHDVAEFRRIKERLNDCPLSDEKKENIKSYIELCSEKNVQFYREIKKEKQKIELAIEYERDQDEYSVKVKFFQSNAEKLEHAMKVLVENPGVALPSLPSLKVLERAYASAKGDLDFCSPRTFFSDKTVVKKGDLLGLKLSVILKEEDATKCGQQTSVNQAILLREKALDVLEAKINYEVAVYTARFETGRKYGGLFITNFGTGNSAGEKLKEARKMLEVVKSLKHNLSNPDDQKPVTWSAGEEANNDGWFRYASALTKLYNEVVKLGGVDETPREKTPFSFNRT